MATDDKNITTIVDNFVKIAQQNIKSKALQEGLYQAVYNTMVKPATGKSGFTSPGTSIGDIWSGKLRSLFAIKPELFKQSAAELYNFTNRSASDMIDSLFAPIRAVKVYLPMFGESVGEVTPVTTTTTEGANYKWTSEIVSSGRKKTLVGSYIFLTEVENPGTNVSQVAAFPSNSTDAVTVLIPIPERERQFFIDSKAGVVYTVYHMFPKQTYVSIGNITTYSNFLYSGHGIKTIGSTSELVNKIVAFSNEVKPTITNSVKQLCGTLLPNEYSENVRAFIDNTSNNALFSNCLTLGLVDSINIPLNISAQRGSAVITWPTSHLLKATSFKGATPLLKSDVPNAIYTELQTALDNLLEEVQNLPTAISSRQNLLENLRSAVVMSRSTKLDTTYLKSHNLFAQVLGSIIHYLNDVSGREIINFVSNISPWDDNKIAYISNLQSPSTLGKYNNFPITLLYVTQDKEYAIKLHSSVYLNGSRDGKHVKVGISNAFMHYIIAYAKFLLSDSGNPDTQVTAETLISAIKGKTSSTTHWRSAEVENLYMSLITAFFQNEQIVIEPTDSKTKLFVNLPLFLKSTTNILVSDKRYGQESESAADLIISTGIQKREARPGIPAGFDLVEKYNHELENTVLADCKPLADYFKEYMSIILSTATSQAELEGTNGVILQIAERIANIYKNIQLGFWTIPEQADELVLGNLYEHIRSERKAQGNRTYADLNMGFLPATISLDTASHLRAESIKQRVSDLGL